MNNALGRDILCLLSLNSTNGLSHPLLIALCTLCIQEWTQSLFCQQVNKLNVIRCELGELYFQVVLAKFLKNNILIIRFDSNTICNAFLLSHHNQEQGQIMQTMSYPVSGCSLVKKRISERACDRRVMFTLIVVFYLQRS